MANVTYILQSKGSRWFVVVVALSGPGELDEAGIMGVATGLVLQLQ